MLVGEGSVACLQLTSRYVMDCSQLRADPRHFKIIGIPRGPHDGLQTILCCGCLG